MRGDDIGQFNKYLKDWAKNYTNFKNNKEYQFQYNSKKEYIDSILEQLNNFDKKLTLKIKKDIDVIIYNNKNTDGLIAATIVCHYLLTEGKKGLDDINFIKTGEGEANRIVTSLKNLYNGKKLNIIILDLDIKEYFYNEIKDITNNVIVIDEHGIKELNNPLAFTTKGLHATCALTWYSFYPKKEIPLIVASIDVSDSKKYASFLSFTNFIAVFITYRYTSSPYVRKKFEDKSIYLELWDIISDNSSYALAIIAGAYMDEVQENIKEQIAQNSVRKKFQGYNVALLNYSDPVLTKRVGRQMIDNWRNQGNPVDFAVLWGYEHNKDSYRVQLIDDHHQTKINMGDLARKLGGIGGSNKGGGGHPHVGNFYWKKDIFQLFK